MNGAVAVQRVLRKANRMTVKVALRRRSPRFECPACEHRGAFGAIWSVLGARRWAVCPRCGALERHRLQAAVVRELVESGQLSDVRVLHCAPDKCLSGLLRRVALTYVTADYAEGEVDMYLDLCRLPFPDASFDLVFASHVLEHIFDDRAAVREIRRVLRPGGIAILPVPVLGEETVEYGRPNPSEEMHVRCPGLDYFARYSDQFDSVKLVSSSDVAGRFQPYIFEDRSHWPPRSAPARVAEPGIFHREYVPVCYVDR